MLFIHHRIIRTIRILIIAKQFSAYFPTCIDKPTCHGIVIPTLQIVEARLSIVVVATVAEGVILGDLVVRGITIAALHRTADQIAPGVVVVLHDPVAEVIEDADNISLQVLLVEIGGRLSVLVVAGLVRIGEADRRAACIVEIGID